MTGSSRKGLKRHGLRGYLVSAAGTTYIIRRIESRKWTVRKSDMPDLGYDFFAICFTTLRDGRKWAFDQIFPGKPKRRIRQAVKRYRSDAAAVLQAAKAIAKARKAKAP